MCWLCQGWHHLRSSEGVGIISSQVFGHLRSFKGWILTEACVTQHIGLILMFYANFIVLWLVYIVLCCANFIVLWLVSLCCVVLISLCCGLCPLCCANFVVFRVVSVELC